MLRFKKKENIWRVAAESLYHKRIHELSCGFQEAKQSTGNSRHVRDAAHDMPISEPILQTS